MNACLTKIISTTRVIGLIGCLTMLGLVSALPAASAADNPVLDGSGYEVHASATVDYPMLIGSGYEGHATVRSHGRETTTMHNILSIDAVLEGSGYDVRVTVAAQDQATASTHESDASSYAARIDAVLGGSGYEADAPVSAATG